LLVINHNYTNDARTYEPQGLCGFTLTLCSPISS